MRPYPPPVLSSLPNVHATNTQAQRPALGRISATSLGKRTGLQPQSARADAASRESPVPKVKGRLQEGKRWGWQRR